MSLSPPTSSPANNQMTTVTHTFTADEARKLTDRIKVDAVKLWSKLLDLYDGGAHTALGYASWGDYYVTEFGQSQPMAYRMLDAARVANVLDHSPIGESVARELASVLKDHGTEVVRSIYQEAVEAHGPKPTAKQVRQVVRKRYPPDPPKPQPKPKAAPKPKPKPTAIHGKSGLSHNPAVVNWVWDRYRHGWTRDQIVAASKAGSDGWPLAGEELSNGGVSECRAVIAHLERLEAQAPPPKATKRKKDSGKPLRELYTKRKNGDTNLYHDVMIPIMEAVRTLENYDLPAEDWSDADEATIIRIYDYLTVLEKWNTEALETTVAQMSDLGRLRKIRDLETLAEHPNTPPHERAAAIRRADALRAKGVGRQIGA